MKHIWTETRRGDEEQERRTGDRRPMALPARLTWKDARGTTRFATVLTRNISDFGVAVESLSPLSIPLYRIVQFQLEREPNVGDGLPPALRGRILSAVYRISAPSAERTQELALRLMIDPRQTSVATEPRRATA